jgi:NAD(P)H-hydrate epimerase
MDIARKTHILDANARYFGFSVLQMIENAGRGIAEEIEKLYGKGKRIAVVCGTGNNGADGFVASRFLQNCNEVHVFLCGKEEEIKTEEARLNYSLLKNSDMHISCIRDSSEATDLFEGFDIIVDALFGIGISGELREPARSIVCSMNTSRAKKVSIDVPSGWGTSFVVRPDLVFNLHFKKTEEGHVLPLGIPYNLEKNIGPGDVRYLSWRKKDSHKGDNGRVLVVGGSEVYVGAPVYCGLASSRIADLVYVCAQKDALPYIKPHPEFIASDFSALDIFIPKSDVIACGCGLGTNAESKKILKKVLASDKKKLFDADALKLLEPGQLDMKCIVTPHAGEYFDLFGEEPSSDNIQRNARMYGCTIVLKGRIDVICQTEMRFNHTGNEGMTTGGTGDVLAGIIAAFASTNDNFEAACAGTFVCGMAGDMVKKERGIHFTASDVLEKISQAIQWCMDF